MEMNEVKEALRNFGLERIDQARGTSADEKSNARKQACMEALEAFKLLKEIEHDEAEFEDKKERREIDQMRVENDAELEVEKQAITWKRVLFEYGKAFGPSIVSVLTALILHRQFVKLEGDGAISGAKSTKMFIDHVGRMINGK